jgi:hypothetical protein
MKMSLCRTVMGALIVVALVHFMPSITNILGNALIAAPPDLFASAQGIFGFALMLCVILTGLAMTVWCKSDKQSSACILTGSALPLVVAAVLLTSTACAGSEQENEPKTSNKPEFVGLTVGRSLDELLNSSTNIRVMRIHDIPIDMSRVMGDLGLTSKGMGPSYTQIVLPEGLRDSWRTMTQFIHDEGLGNYLNMPSAKKITLINEEQGQIFSAIDTYFYEDRVFAFDFKSNGGFRGEEIIDRWLERYDGIFLGQANIHASPHASHSGVIHSDTGAVVVYSLTSRGGASFSINSSFRVVVVDVDAVTNLYREFIVAARSLMRQSHQESRDALDRL